MPPPARPRKPLQYHSRDANGREWWYADPAAAAAAAAATAPIPPPPPAAAVAVPHSTATAPTPVLQYESRTKASVVLPALGGSAGAGFVLLLVLLLTGSLNFGGSRSDESRRSWADEGEAVQLLEEWLAGGTRTRLRPEEIEDAERAIGRWTDEKDDER